MEGYSKARQVMSLGAKACSTKGKRSITTESESRIWRL
jgi:hypothetical protein